MKHLSIVAALAAMLSSFSLPAAAQAAKEAEVHSVSGNFSLVSEYRYRGIGQTDLRPALQGGIDYAHKNGVYLGTWGSNVSWLSDAGAGGSSVELDVYGGYKGSVGDLGYDVGLLQYYYPGSFSGTKPNTLEAYIGASWKMFSLKYSHSLTNLFGVPDSKGSSYIDLGASLDVGGGITLAAHAGYQRVKNASDCSYTDWKLGASKDFAGFTWALNYIDTDAKDACYLNYRNKNLGKGAVVLSIGKTF